MKREENEEENDNVFFKIIMINKMITCNQFCK